MDTRPKWLQDGSRGFEAGEQWVCVIDGKQWAVIKIPGRKCWLDMLNPSVYCPVEYRLTKKDDVWRSGRSLREGGKPTKTELNEWRELVSFLDGGGNAMRTH